MKSRVHLGDHDVLVDKIVSHYARSLDLLLPASMPVVFVQSSKSKEAAKQARFEYIEGY